MRKAGDASPGARVSRSWTGFKFRHKLFFSYVVVIIIPILVLGIYSYYQSSTYLLDKTKQGLTESVNQMAETLNYKLNKYDSVLRFMANNEQMVQIINNDDASYFTLYVNYAEVLDPLFATVLSLNPDMVKLMIYTDNKNVIERSESIQSLSRIQAKPWLKDTLSDWQVHWIVEDHSLLGMTRLVEPFRGAPTNLLYAQLKYSSVFDAELKSISNYGLLVTDEAGDVIYTRNSIADPRLANVESAVARLPNGENTISGVRSLLIHSSIPETQWTLTYYAPLQALGANTTRIADATVIIIVVCLGFLLLLTWLFSSTFVKRIDRLNRKMRIVEAGVLDVVVHSDSRDEIGELTNRFGMMLHNINALIADVYRSKIIQKEAELKALQAQINPHFLYNTLSIINWKAIQAGMMDISRITNNMSKFYRTVLNTGNDDISVRDEIANINYYTEIQLVMHDHAFDMEFVVADSIMEYRMINLILQPIVENAIEYGVDLLREGRGRIRITGQADEDFIWFTVEDNGPGFEQAAFERALTTPSSGYGLRNVDQRLKIAFGETYGLSLVPVPPGKGTCIRVTIPKITNSQKNDTKDKNLIF